MIYLYTFAGEQAHHPLLYVKILAQAKKSHPLGSLSLSLSLSLSHTHSLAHGLGMKGEGVCMLLKGQARLNALYS